MEILRRQIQKWRRYLWIALAALLVGTTVSFGAHSIYATTKQQESITTQNSPTVTPIVTATATSTPTITLVAQRNRSRLPLLPRPRIQSPLLGSGGDPGENTGVFRLPAGDRFESPLMSPTVPVAATITSTRAVSATDEITMSKAADISNTTSVTAITGITSTGELTVAAVESESIAASYTMSDTSPLTATYTVSITGLVTTESLTDGVAVSSEPTHAEENAVADTEEISSTAAITELLEQSITGGNGDQVAVTNEEAPNPLALLVPTPTPVPLEPTPLGLPTPDGVERTLQVPILMYHYISTPPPDADVYRQDLSVSPELFAAHLDAIVDNGYNAITLYELADYFADGTPLPPNPVIITFDDGYVDNYSNALPLLRERSIPATFFVLTDFMDEQRPGYLTWDMAREMRDVGMKIESHGRNHVSLKNKDHDYLVWQALGSLETIEYELGVRPRFVSYPAGEYDQNTIDLFKSAGYWAGVTTVQGATQSSESKFELHRIRVRGTTTAQDLLNLLALDW